MADFTQEISDFQRYGTYTYQFDSSGNQIFNSSSADFSQVYLSLPLKNVVYNKARIEQFYDPQFEEFIPTTGSAPITSSMNDLQDQLNIIQSENLSLKSQLDDVIAQNASVSSASDSQVVKQVILELRKALGQGRIDANFSDTFPYAPLTTQKAKPEKI